MMRVLRGPVGALALLHELTVDGHRLDAQAPGAGRANRASGQGRERFRIETGVGRARLAMDRRHGPGG